MEDLFLRSALAYAALGYAVFPLRVGDKRPATEHGFFDATTDEEQIDRWWKGEPMSNVAIRTDGLVVVDVDGESNPWLHYDEEKLLELTSAPMAKTPRGGVHYWFRQPEGKRWSVSIGKLAPNVDTRAAGGYVAVPPSRRARGAYEWIPGSGLDVAPEGLPLPPGWLSRELDEIQAGRRFRSIHSEYRGEEIPSGTRNSVLASIAGTLRRHGLEEGAIAAALLEVNRERCAPPLEGDEVLRIAASILRYEPDQIATILAEGRSDGPAPRDDEEPEDPGGFPEDLVEVPGFVHQVVRYTLGTAPRPQPVFALAGALALMSVLTGRKIRDAQNIRTNIYGIVVGKTGSGKDRPREVAKEILIGAGAEQLLGPEEIQSGTGLLTAVKSRPACLLQPDEIGRLLMTAKDPRGSPYLFSIISNLLKLYSSSGGSFRAGGYADASKGQTINQPHVAFLGTTVFEAFTKSMTTEELTNGFISRLLVFSSLEFPDIQDFEWVSVPAEITREARLWHELRPGGNLADENPAPKVLPYSGAAESELREFQHYCDALARGKAYGAGIWTRAAEKARKLAMLYAASEHGVEVQEVGEGALRWAARLSEYSTRLILKIAHDWIADSQWETVSKKILRIVKEHAPLTMREFSRKTQWLRQKERDQALAGLIECGLVVKRLRETRGRSATVIDVASRGASVKDSLLTDDGMK